MRHVVSVLFINRWLVWMQSRVKSAAYGLCTEATAIEENFSFSCKVDKMCGSETYNANSKSSLRNEEKLFGISM